jgi:antitoxin ParD1/3/4
MATMNLSLPDPIKAGIERPAESGRYGNASDYSRDLIRKHQQRLAAVDQFQAAITRGGESVRRSPSIPRPSNGGCARAMAPASRGSCMITPEAPRDLESVWAYGATLGPRSGRSLPR